MATYSEHEQRLLDQKSGEEMDQHKAASNYLNLPKRSEREVRNAQVRRQLKASVALIRSAISGRCFLDDDEDFLTLADALFDACCAMKAEREQEEAWEREAVERCNYDMRRA